jgi:hypothetical protein
MCSPIIIIPLLGAILVAGPALAQDQQAQIKQTLDLLTNLGGRWVWPEEPLPGIAIYLRGCEDVSPALLEKLKPLREHLVWVSFAGTNVMDSDLRVLRDFPKVAHLDLGRTAITDRALAEIKPMDQLVDISLLKTKVINFAALCDFPNLTQLNLNGTGITDGDLAALKPMEQRLTRLNLAQTRITDEGLTQLQGLTNLESLDLHRTAVTGNALANLRGMKKLVVLQLDYTLADDAAAGAFRELQSLNQIHLTNTRITDACLPSIAALPELVILNVSGTAVSDEGVASFEKMKKLKDLSIQGTRISAAGAERLVRSGTLNVDLDDSQVTQAMREDQKRGLVKFSIVAPPKPMPQF